ncbi:hypothetical protein KIPB_001486 [Kipferlia bialata]|uniref:Uncharacterized protein n=2 Tax=Kipferlia bialata TaxID=797122 RepID=A0A9K3GFK8_9EUKA|nr:hypothetical protein KIPB_001486 [Kipferlia bialata]|eukprot:g1486.t1
MQRPVVISGARPSPSKGREPSVGYYDDLPDTTEEEEREKERERQVAAERQYARERQAEEERERERAEIERQQRERMDKERRDIEREREHRQREREVYRRRQEEMELERERERDVVRVASPRYHSVSQDRRQSLERGRLSRSGSVTAHDMGERERERAAAPRPLSRSGSMQPQEGERERERAREGGRVSRVVREYELRDIEVDPSAVADRRTRRAPLPLPSPARPLASPMRQASVVSASQGRQDRERERGRESPAVYRVNPADDYGHRRSISRGPSVERRDTAQVDEERERERVRPAALDVSDSEGREQEGERDPRPEAGAGDREREADRVSVSMGRQGEPSEIEVPDNILSFVMSQPADPIPLPGSSRPDKEDRGRERDRDSRGRGRGRGDGAGFSDVSGSVGVERSVEPLVQRAIRTIPPTPPRWE